MSPRGWAWKWCTSLLPRTQLYSHFVLAAGRAKKCSLATSPRRQENGRGRAQTGRLDQWNSDRELSRENGDRQPALVLTGGS